MALVATLEGELAIWKQILAISTIGYPWCRLFGSAHTPAHPDTIATYVPIELSVAGYAPKSLSNPAANWSFMPIVAPSPTAQQATYVLLTWTFTGACVVYGYWLNDQTNTFSLWAEQFANPIIFGPGGGIFTLQLQPWLASSPSFAGIPC